MSWPTRPGTNAPLAITRTPGQFRAKSRFTTWASKFRLEAFEVL